MPYPTEPKREQPSTYMVQDRENLDEMERLKIQDKMMTTGMGGVLPEIADPTQLRRVLDVGCGTGGWLMETARTYPGIEKLVGVDISNSMVAYARTQVQDQQLAGRVQFEVMDALRILEFPRSYFDLVNQRLGISWLRTWEWNKILTEYGRVTKSGGIIRITEGNINAEHNSPALAKLFSIFLEAFYHSGRLFTPTSDGVTNELPRLMTQHHIKNVQTQVHTTVHRAGTPAGQDFYEDAKRMSRLLLPFYQKWAHVPDDYQEICQQALKEMQQPDFVATSTLVTVWGTKSY